MEIIFDCVFQFRYLRRWSAAINNKIQIALEQFQLLYISKVRNDDDNEDIKIPSYVSVYLNCLL